MWGDCTVVLTLAEFPGHIWLVPVRQPVGSVTRGLLSRYCGCGASVGPLQFEHPPQVLCLFEEW